MLSLTKSSYWKNVQPVGALADFRKVFRDAGSNRWRIGVAAAATTLFLFWLLTHETWRAPPPRPHVVYINSWPASRTMAETKKFIAANQKQKDEIAAQQAKADEEVRQMYKALGRVSGMDVDKIEQDAKAQAKSEAQSGAQSGAKPSVAPDAGAPAQAQQQAPLGKP